MSQWIPLICGKNSEQLNISKLALSVICALATLRHALGTTFVSSAITNVHVLYYSSSEWLQ